MKRFSLLLFALCAFLLGAQAAVSFDASKKYRFVSKRFNGTGNMVLGSNHGSTALIYYDVTSSDIPADAWWYVEAGTNGGYSIRNAVSNEYIIYSSVREERVAKGLRLSSSLSGTTTEWTFTETSDGYLTIGNVREVTQWFNIRTDGTYLVGTYTGNTGSDNELFTILDEEGNSVMDGESKPDPTPTTEDKGVTPSGAYWERIGLAQPVVYTTDTSNPVLYTIINLRRQQYVVASSNVLYQTSDEDQATAFYFVQSGNGVQVYTSTGEYIKTAFTQLNEGNYGLSTASGVTDSNIWQINWETGLYDSSYQSVDGYSLTKLTDLPADDTATKPGQKQSSKLSWNDYGGNYIGLWDVDDGSTFAFASADQRHLNYLASYGITFEGVTTDPDADTEFLRNTRGQSEVGEYWERVGVDNPIVGTTDTSNPVLYSILNLKQNKYVKAGTDALELTDNPDERTHFYFVTSGTLTRIFTEDGRLVFTDYSTTDALYGHGVNVLSQSVGGGMWKIDKYVATVYSAYSLMKSDNLNTGSLSGLTQSSYRYWSSTSGNVVPLGDLSVAGSFVFTSADTRHLDNLTGQGINFDGGADKPTGEIAMTTAVETIRISGKDVIRDTNSGIWYSPLPSPVRNGAAWAPTLEAVFKSGYENFTLQLNGLTPDAETHVIDFSDVNCDQTYSFQLYDEDGTLRSTAQVQFTYLPLVEINMPSCNGTTYTTGSMRVTDPDLAGYDPEVIAAFRYRGATAQGFAKKAYAIKLRDEAGNSVDRQYFGLRSDNNWILDAMAVDPACMRNRVSTDLWNDFATPPYYKDRESKALTGTRGKFVEVFLNGKYHGLYCMTEKLDRKQMKLKKYKDAATSTSGKEEIHGVLYKSTQWSYEVFMGHDINSDYYPHTPPSAYSNTLGTEVWGEYELKYPDFEEEAVDWQPLYNAVNLVACTNDVDFGANVKNYFDYPVVRDYYLFIELMLATDNHGKNMHWAVYDKSGAEGNRLTIAPWDMDGTWGINWAGKTSYTNNAEQDFDSFLWTYEHGQLTLFTRLQELATLTWEDDLKERYAELRANWFNEDKLVERFQTYAALFADSRADLREQSRWPTLHNQIQSSVAYAAQWIPTRVAYLDEKYGYDPTLSSVNDAKAENYLKITGASRSIGISAGVARTVRIYALSGQLARTAQVGPGFTEVNGLEPGVYVVEGQKVLVRQ